MDINQTDGLIAGVHAFQDGSHRALVSLTEQGLRDTETWLPLDPDKDVTAQHADLAKRLHRLVKVRVQHMLNNLAQAAHWQRHLADLRGGTVKGGYDPQQMFYDDLTCDLLRQDLTGLPALVEQGRVAGFLNFAEAETLRRGGPIEVSLDPRPAGIGHGPPLVGEMM